MTSYLPSLPSPLSLLHQLGFLQPTNWTLSRCPPLTNKVALITGGAGGIGSEITKQLLLHDIASIIVLSRSLRNFTHARDTDWIPALAAANIDVDRVNRVRFVECDLIDLAAVDRVGGMLAGELQRLDMLFLNAALLISSSYTLSPQGIESAFAANHLSGFLLTQLLLPVLSATPRRFSVPTTRIIVSTSSLHIFCRALDFDAVVAPGRGGGGYGAALDGLYRYARSKLANVVFTKTLSRRLPREVIVNVYFPGNVATPAMDAWKGLVGPLGGVVSAVFRVVGQTLEDAAATGVFLGCAEEVESGGWRGAYWVPVATVEACSGVAEDEGLGERLWAWSEEMVGRMRAGTEGTEGVEGVEGVGVYVNKAGPTCVEPVPVV